METCCHAGLLDGILSCSVPLSTHRSILTFLCHKGGFLRKKWAQIPLKPRFPRLGSWSVDSKALLSASSMERSCMQTSTAGPLRSHISSTNNSQRSRKHAHRSLLSKLQVLRIKRLQLQARMPILRSQPSATGLRDGRWGRRWPFVRSLQGLFAGSLVQQSVA